MPTDDKTAEAKPNAEALTYEPIFDPEKPEDEASGVLSSLSPYGTVKPPLPYVFHVPEIELAVNVALATKRPLLLSGRPGSGKSTLARTVASALGWEYQEDTITSRTHANDLLWSFDALQRLSDASTQDVSVREEAAYVKPGVLWWTFDPVSAYEAHSDVAGGKPPAGLEDVKGIVVLLDEIDKAEPDVPNDLLVPLSDRKFNPKGHDQAVLSTKEYLLCITTNGERELPQAFVRRCVTLSLTRPELAMLRKIAVAHVAGLRVRAKLLTEVLGAFTTLEKQMIEEHRRPPSTAEFLDAVKACTKLKPSDRAKLAQFTMRKTIEVRDPDV